jgi:hypothetical protein
VDRWVAGALSPGRPVTLRNSLAALAIACSTVGVTAIAVHGAAPTSAQPDPAFVPLALVLALALTPYVEHALGGRAGTLPGTVMRAMGVAALYLGVHELTRRALGGSMPLTASATAWPWVVAGFGLLFAAQTLMSARPHGWLARALQPRLYAGLYLDELYSRLVFRVWPPRLPAKSRAASPAPLTPATEL